MSRRPSVIQRIALITIVAVASAYLTAGLLAVGELEATSELVARGYAGLPLSEQKLEDARDGLARARSFNDDAPLLYAELGLLTVMGQPRHAARLARRLSELEPESFDAWRSVYTLAGQRDPGLAARARARALELNPVAERELPPVNRTP